MKKPWKAKIGHFLAGRGFYIVLFLCVTAIGISGYLLFSANSQDPSSLSHTDPLSVGGQTEVVLPSPQTSGESASPKPTSTTTPTQKPSPAPSPSNVPTAAEANESFVRPVAGETVTAFHSDALVYNETFKDWRTHEAIDIKADIGSKVMAISAGTVSDLYEDDLMGTTVVISHRNNLTSVYSNLAATPTVKKGDTVRAGDVIGAVGKTSIAESNGVSHLHFALQKNGVAVNPDDYLPHWAE
ncbi:MAG: peptidoglycan DD-metalloendopeptidase family protein [Oscillospiraceae bacterium]|jgi:murein DD-endopeptidase MepM/ murein hydrolase activator NlpD